MIDSHCHLTDARFADDLDAVLQRAWDAGLTGIVTIASDAADADVAWQLSRRDPRIHSTAGVHPHTSGQAGPGDLEQIQEILSREGVVAVGETGLDFHYDNSPRDVQRQLFEWHLAVAAESDLPVVVHSRSADDDMATMIRNAAGVTGVLHCFSGGAGLMETALEAGWYISFAGMVSFRNYGDGDLVRHVPPQRLLIETDSPYLAPVPHRGKRNEPAFVAETCNALARLRTEDPATLAGTTTDNARKFYKL
jgi:TatD DNase family protein